MRVLKLHNFSEKYFSSKASLFGGRLQSSSWQMSLLSVSLLVGSPHLNPRTGSKASSTTLGPPRRCLLVRVRRRQWRESLVVLYVERSIGSSHRHTPTTNPNGVLPPCWYSLVVLVSWAIILIYSLSSSCEWVVGGSGRVAVEGTPGHRASRGVRAYTNGELCDTSTGQQHTTCWMASQSTSQPQTKTPKSATSLPLCAQNLPLESCLTLTFGSLCTD